jgi:putative restriction endonuclease
LPGKLSSPILHSLVIKKLSASRPKSSTPLHMMDAEVGRFAAWPVFPLRSDLLDADLDARLRTQAFAYLNEIDRAGAGLVTREQLEAFAFEGQRVPLIARQRGIHKPSQLPSALSILTTYSARPELRPYEDEVGPDGYLRYKWRGSDPDHWDNRALRLTIETQTPIIWFRGVAPGVFVAQSPVWVVGEEPVQQQFVVAIDELLLGWTSDLAERPNAPERRYAERLVRTRLHQRVFSGQVLHAYDRQCALCRLRRRELLGAAHIKPDAQGGEPIVPNGIAMCALHHRAFDSNVLGIDPRYRIEIRHDVLGEPDGPTLTYALQGLHGEMLTLPRRRAEHPREDLLEERYEEFRAAG